MLHIASANHIFLMTQISYFRAKYHHMLRLVPPFICLLIIMSCQNLQKKQTAEEKQKELSTGTLSAANIYTADEIGWKVQLPSDWEVVSKRDVAKTREKGQEMIEKASGQKVDL